MSIDEIQKTALSPGFEKKNQNLEATLRQSEPLQNSQEDSLAQSASTSEQRKEVGGRIGLDPTRYGDWEKNGRCIDF